MLSSSCQTPFWYDLLQNFSTTYIITNMQNVKEILDLMKSLAPQDGAVIEKEFGKEVLFLVQGVTKLGKLKYQGVERHVESLRKMFIATAQDMRVLIIKLADRLHNIKTLYGHEKKDKQRRIALETLEIYAPLA